MGIAYSMTCQACPTRAPAGDSIPDSADLLSRSVTIRGIVTTERYIQETSMKIRLWITVAVAMLVGMLIGLLAPTTHEGDRHGG
ncbi:hypothetical protein GCM10010116_31770 [Microbispora rosea subsp. aerata]|nr:hypothetical protein GCM10010116_31770 [Microbispora rosea subsp. aerata]GIH58689.1 hypothetical protein Mro02_56030 [Microbispora rosea subsp. aerata]GLJ86942.1 hypothetical protein GCM10017588_56850 [Microbispora rosea subsp. aerata]